MNSDAVEYVPKLDGQGIGETRLHEVRRTTFTRRTFADRCCWVARDQDNGDVSRPAPRASDPE